jgi:hypothetical protein
LRALFMWSVKKLILWVEPVTAAAALAFRT